MLEGLRVLDFTRGIAGPYCTKLLADAGADVVMAEPGLGHPERKGGPAGLFDYLHTSKRSVTAGEVVRLLDLADVIVADGRFDVAAARRANPRQVVTTIAPFGTTGPWRDRPATEFTLQAMCGSTGGRGLPEQSPLAAGGRLGEWLTGAYAGVGTLAAWMEASRSGWGDHVDVAMLDCMAIGLVTMPTVFADFAASCGRPPMVGARRSIEVPSIEPTADGYVNFTTNSAQQFSDFCVLIGHPEIAEDERFARATPRFEHREEFWAMVRQYTTAHTSAEVLEQAALLRIPSGPVLNGATVQGFEQFEARGVFVEHPSGAFRQPRVPYRLFEHEPPVLGPVPSPGEHDGRVEWEPRPAAGVSDEWRLPLSGTKVFDLTAWWAGPCATHILGTLGADVWKVESTKRPDLLRFATSRNLGDPDWWEWGPLAHATNTNKRGVTIDLVTEEGRSLALEVIRSADLLVENYTPRVIEQFLLDWEVLHEVNPQLSMIRMPAFGLDGPWRDRTGFAQTMESLTGMAWVTGFPDGPPVLVRGAGDPLAGLHAAFSAMLALYDRRSSGRGQLVESTMVEAALNAAAGQAIGYQLSGEVAMRRGNRSAEGAVPQGIYRCRGEEAWLALAVEDDEQWAELVGVLAIAGPVGGFDLASKAGGMRLEDRLEHEEAIDIWIGQVAAEWDAGELAERLVSRGVPAAEVALPPAIKENPQLQHRGFFEPEVHPVTGTHVMPVMPLRLSRVEHWLRRPAPTIGEHNDEVYAEIGIAADEQRRLRELDIIGEGLANPEGMASGS